jgi:hypothetical protein
MIKVCQEIRVYKEDEELVESIEDIQGVNEEEINDNNNNNGYNEEDYRIDVDSEGNSIPGLQDREAEDSSNDDDDDNDDNGHYSGNANGDVPTRATDNNDTIGFLEETGKNMMMTKIVIATMTAIVQTDVDNKNIRVKMY